MNNQAHQPAHIRMDFQDLAAMREILDAMEAVLGKTWGTVTMGDWRHLREHWADMESSILDLWRQVPQAQKDWPPA